MAKATQKYICSQCGTATTKWSGRCAQCGEWNTLELQSAQAAGVSSSGAALKGAVLKDLEAQPRLKRLITPISPLNDVLGGGLVPGSVLLLSGQPGIGKSTILLQLVKEPFTKRKALYVSGEESLSQIHDRAMRLGVANDDLELVTSNSSDDIAATILSGAYDLVIIDSIQTVQSAQLPAAAGTPSQLNSSAQMIIQAAKQQQTAVVLVGHVTKEGVLAGPKLLEHIVDVVLHFEGDRYGGFKTIRSVKNRYGSTDETAIFDMTSSGLETVEKPSAALLAERQVADGSIVAAIMDGHRPLLVEVQALVTPSNFGYPKRTASGFDLNRLNVLIAVLSQRTSLKLDDKDIFLNIVGGVRVQDPGVDLAVCMAIASAARGAQLVKDAAVFGEVGLGGEVRRARLADKRIAEAQGAGFTHTIGPALPRANKIHQPVTNLRDSLNKFLARPGATKN